MIIVLQWKKGLISYEWARPYLVRGNIEEWQE